MIEEGKVGEMYHYYWQKTEDLRQELTLGEDLRDVSEKISGLGI